MSALRAADLVLVLERGRDRRARHPRRADGGGRPLRAARAAVQSLEGRPRAGPFGGGAVTEPRSSGRSSWHHPPAARVHAPVRAAAQHAGPAGRGALDSAAAGGLGDGARASAARSRAATPPGRPWASAGFLALAGFTELCFVFRVAARARLGEAVVHDLRNEIYAHLLRMPLELFLADAGGAPHRAHHVGRRRRPRRRPGRRVRVDGAGGPRRCLGRAR